MISIPFLICLIGLIFWFIFAKTKVADSWVADVAEGGVVSTGEQILIALGATFLVGMSLGLVLSLR